MITRRHLLLGTASVAAAAILPSVPLADASVPLWIDLEVAEGDLYLMMSRRMSCSRAEAKRLLYGVMYAGREAPLLVVA